MSATPWTPTLREAIAVTSNTKRRLMLEAIERYPDVPIMLAMWRTFVDGMDALAREVAAAAEVRRVAAAALVAVTCTCPEGVTCGCRGAP